MYLSNWELWATNYGKEMIGKRMRSLATGWNSRKAHCNPAWEYISVPIVWIALALYLSWECMFLHLDLFFLWQIGNEHSSWSFPPAAIGISVRLYCTVLHLWHGHTGYLSYSLMLSLRTIGAVFQKPVIPLSFHPPPPPSWSHSYNIFLKWGGAGYGWPTSCTRHWSVLNIQWMQVFNSMLTQPFIWWSMWPSSNNFWRLGSWCDPPPIIHLHESMFLPEEHRFLTDEHMLR